MDDLAASHFNREQVGHGGADTERHPREAGDIGVHIDRY
jgi:hypothetical protein